jgi:hypothetical protein
VKEKCHPSGMRPVRSSFDSPQTSWSSPMLQVIFEPPAPSLVGPAAPAIARDADGASSRPASTPAGNRQGGRWGPLGPCGVQANADRKPRLTLLDEMVLNLP